MQALERAMAELVLGLRVPADDPVAIEAWLSRSGVSADDASVLRAEIERLGVYRTLVRERLRDAVTLAIPRTEARLGALFDEYFERYLAEHGPRTRVLRDVTTEFLDFVTPLVRADPRVPPWAADLARHEALDIVVGSLADEPVARVLPELDPDRGLAFSATARVVRYRFAVHRLSSDTNDRTEPEAIATALFVHRNHEHEVRYLELTPAAVAILERLLAGETLRRALELGTRAAGVPLDAAVLDGTARLLADLAERGAVLGARDGENATTDLQLPAQTTENAGSPDTPPRDEPRTR